MFNKNFSVRKPLVTNVARILLAIVVIAGLFVAVQSNTPAVKANAAALGYYPLDNAVAFGTWLGRPVQYAMGYTARATWANISGADAGWLLDPAQAWKAADPTHRRYIISIPMVPEPLGQSGIATCGGGSYNSYFVTLGNNLVGRGMADTVIRLAWEMNGSWFPGGYVGTTTTTWNNWKNCWIQIVTAMRGVSGNQFIYDFNPNAGNSDSGTFMSSYYPGDAYVDVIALDLYDFYYGTCGVNFTTRWNHRLTEAGGLNEYLAFANSHNKPMAFDEWGLWGTASPHCGGGDSPEFINAMADWFAANNVAWHSYFDVSADSDHRLNTYPNAKAQYKVRFGTVPATNTPLGPTATRTNTPIPGTATSTPVNGAYDDEFSVTTLAGKWSWVRQDSANWSLSAAPGYMRITCQAGEINGTNTTAKNILLETAPAGDWTVITKVTGKPNANWAQAGILVYQNDDNWLKVDRVYSDANVFQVGKETAGTYTYTNTADGIASTTSYMKIVKSGANYSAYYSADGVSYTQVGTTQAITLSTIKVGLMCYGGTGLTADFDYIRITTAGGPTNTPVPPTNTPTNTPVGPTATNTPVPPTATRTNTPVPPTATNTPVPGGNTHAGTWAAKGVLTGGWNNMYQNVSATTSSTYVVSIWIKGSGTIRLRAFNSSWSTTLATIDCTATGAWTQCTTPSFNTGSNSTVVFAVADAASGTMYLDDAFMGVSGQTNKVVNPGFESGNTTWTVASPWSILQP